jgi:hypothetical protein
MRNAFPPAPLGLPCRVFIFSIVWVLFNLSQAHAAGQGPIGVWPVSARHVLVADSSLPGLVLVDLQTGIATERLRMDKMRPVGVASCPGCDFVLISSGANGNFWLLHLEGTTSGLIEKTGKLGLANARLEALQIDSAEGSLVDGRMVLVSDDGKTAFIASMEDHALFKVDFTKKPNAQALLQGKGVQPYGVNWDARGGLLVSMHKRVVWRVTVDGEVLAIYDTKAAGCPGTSEFKPKLRAAVDDPVNEGSVLILATNPNFKDAVIWRLQVDSQGRQSCINAFGKAGEGPGWVDASGEAAEFSRPHYFTLRPNTQPPQAILTDIDNRALRLLDLATYTTSTVMYNRDHTLTAVAPEERASKVRCAQLEWKTISARLDPAETLTCIQLPKSDALQLTLAQAKDYCSAQGARLCEPAELLASDSATAALAWSAAECASCWQSRAGEHCGANITDNKTLGMPYSRREFPRSWHSGQALAAFDPTAGSPARTVCLPVDAGLKAAAPCCAD